MPKKATEIAGYTVLPLRLPVVPSFPQSATHYLYLHPHEPRDPDPDAARSLFLVNIPVDTTETHLRHLFSSQLSAGRVERVEFEGIPGSKQQVRPKKTQHAETDKGKKRKRGASTATAEEFEQKLAEIDLPSTWNRLLHPSGSHAVVVFVDKPAMAVSLKAARRAAATAAKHSEKMVVWGDGLDSDQRVPLLGLKRYQTRQKLIYPPREDLLRVVNEYMTTFTAAEEARARDAARRAAEPDEDGFVTVTRGPKTQGIGREEEIKELLAKQKQREEGLGDFYRFQTREKRKYREKALIRGFEEDRRKIEEVRRVRGKVTVSSFLSLFFRNVSEWLI